MKIELFGYEAGQREKEASQSIETAIRTLFIDRQNPLWRYRRPAEISGHPPGWALAEVVLHGPQWRQLGRYDIRSTQRADDAGPKRRCLRGCSESSRSS